MFAVWEWIQKGWEGGAQSFVVLMVTPTWMTSDYRTCVCKYIKVLIKS